MISYCSRDIHKGEVLLIITVDDYDGDGDVYRDDNDQIITGGFVTSVVGCRTNIHQYTNNIHFQI